MTPKDSAPDNRGPNGPDSDDFEITEVQEEVKEKSSKKFKFSLRSKFALAAIGLITSPLWIPAAAALGVAAATAKGVWWGLKREGKFNKALASTFAAAAGIAAMGAVAYGTAFGVVAVNETRLFGMNGWPASQGHWTGTVARFEEKGRSPCNSFEGNIRTAEAADSEKFSVRKYDTEIIKAIKEAGNTELLLVYRKSGLDQESFGKITDMGKDFDKIDATWWLGCIQHTDHNVVGVHYTNPQTGKHVSVGLDP